MDDKRHTLLIVDDEPDILDSLSLSLELDYEVLTATSGADGLALLKQHDVALIISDQRMPKMTGVAFLAEAQKLSPASVRMMLTGFADFDAIVQAINDGQIFRYISKPWEPHDLEIDVRQAVARYEMAVSLDRRMVELQALCDIGATITSELDRDKVMQKILDGVVETLGFDRSFLLIVDEAANRLRFSGCAGASDEVRAFLAALEYDLDRDDVGVVLTVKEDRPILVEDVDHPPVHLDAEAVAHVGFRSFVTSPLRAAGRPIGVLVADRSGAGDRVTEHDQRLLVGFADQAAIALENARLYGEALEKQRLEEEVNVAAKIQAHLLPKQLPEVDGFDIAAVSRPSRGVSGDYYDVVADADGRVWIALGDVCGKGVPAALTMATLRTLFRSEIDRNRPIEEMMQRVSEGLFLATAPEVFATFCFGVLDPANRTFVFVNAGHPFPILASADGTTRDLDHAGLPIGFDPIMNVVPYEPQCVALNAGDVFVIYSDGVAEAGASGDEMFGEERLREVVTKQRDHGAAAVERAVSGAVASFMNGAPMDDDLTLVVLATCS